MTDFTGWPSVLDVSKSTLCKDPQIPGVPFR
jgi:hypothetical protein